MTDTGRLTPEDKRRGQEEGWIPSDELCQLLAGATQDAFLRALCANQNINAEMYSRDPDKAFDTSPVIQGAVAAILQFMVEGGMSDADIQGWLTQIITAFLPQMRAGHEARQLGIGDTVGRA